MRMTMVVLVSLFLIGMAANAMAQTSTWGLIQTWYSYAGLDEAKAGIIGGDSYGQTSFAMKRMRIGFEHKQGEFTGFFFYDAVPAKAVDAWIKYQVNEKLNIQAGRFVGVGSQAGGLTSPVKLDLVDYPAMADGWASMTHGADSRTIGVQGNYKVNDRIRASLLLHNGNGNGNGMFSTNDTTPAAGETGFLPKIDLGLYADPNEQTKLALTFGIPNEFRPQAGMGGTEFITATTAFGQYKREEYRARVDFVYLASKAATWDDESDDYHAYGYAITVARQMDENLELVGRFDSWEPSSAADDDLVQNVTVGANWAFLPAAPYDQRLQANIIYRMDEFTGGGDFPSPLVFQVQWQAFIH